MGELLTYTIKQTKSEAYVTKKWGLCFIRDRGDGNDYSISDNGDYRTNQGFNRYPKMIREFYIKLKYRK